MKATRIVECGGQAWTCEQVCEVARGQLALKLGDDLRAHLERGEVFLGELLATRARIYGLTTGFGPLASTLVPPEHREALQRQLIAHLATGVGPVLDPVSSRAVMCARLITLSQGYSCAPVALMEMMMAFLNAGLAPVIPRHGSVGASGDLTPLAHMARGLMGEGELWDASGERVSARDALMGAGIEPLVPRDREGLALVNGTSAMTAMGAMTAVRMSAFLDLCSDIAVAYGEVMGAGSGAWSELVGVVRGQPGQLWVHEGLGRRLEGSARMSATPDTLIALPDEFNAHGVSLAQPMVQDAYSMRCVPQLLGAIKDVMDWHRGVVERELVAVTDNPIFDVEAGQVVHAGNFYGQHVASVSDALKNALVNMMVWLERVAARLCDAGRSRGLPAFLVWNPGSLGLQSGFMGAQVTASALVALARTRAGTPASTQSISTNAGNQDVVTMGTIAAMECDALCERASELLAIVAMMVAQAMELRDEQLVGFAPSSVALWRRVRERSPRLERDRSLSDEISVLARQFNAQN